MKQEEYLMFAIKNTNNKIRALLSWYYWKRRKALHQNIEKKLKKIWTSIISILGHWQPYVHLKDLLR